MPKPAERQAVGLLATASSDEAVHRLDLHPTMARRPVTPMDEADLRRVLERQTARHLADGRSVIARLTAGSPY